MVSGTRHADGRLVVTSWRCLWKSEAIKFSIAESNQLTATLSVGKSSTDDEAVAAITAAAVSAALKGVVPMP